MFEDDSFSILTIEAAETFCMACVPSEEHILRKKYLGNRPFKKSHFILNYKGFTIKFYFYGYFKNCKMTCQN